MEHRDSDKVVLVFSVRCPEVYYAYETNMPRFCLVLGACLYLLDFRRKDLCSMLQAVHSNLQGKVKEKENRVDAIDEFVNGCPK